MSDESFRIFTYVRKDKVTGKEKYKADIIVKDGNIICYGETLLPAGISEDTAMKFFEEAERSVMKKVDTSLNKYGG